MQGCAVSSAGFTALSRQADTFFHRLSASAARRDDARQTLHCPPDPGDGSIVCLRFANPDADAFWDFFLHVLILRQGGDTAAMISSVALPDGELAVFTAHNEYLKIFKSRFVKTLELEAKSFGVVALGHAEVTTRYEAMRDFLITQRFLFQRRRADGTLMAFEEIESGSGFPFPALLPEGLGQRGPDAASFALLAAEGLTPAEAIHFPQFREREDGDVEVEGGVEIAAQAPDPSLARHLGARAPGVYIDFLQQNHPTFAVLSIYTLVPARGTWRLLFMDHCSKTEYRFFRRRIFVDRKSSWFKKKTKIRIVHDELVRLGRECGTVVIEAPPPR